MLERLEHLTNPASWLNNPKIAEQNFNEVKKILKMETGTYREASKSTKEFEPSGEKKMAYNVITKKWEER